MSCEEHHNVAKVLPGIAGIPPGTSDASGGIGPRHIVTSTSGFSARCRPMRPISPMEFQLKLDKISAHVPCWPMTNKAPSCISPMMLKVKLDPGILQGGMVLKKAGP